MQKGTVHTEKFAMPGSPADDSPEYVTATLVGRQNTIADEEGARPGMVCNDPNGDINILIRAVFLSRKVADKGDERGEQIGVIIALYPLEYTR